MNVVDVTTTDMHIVVTVGDDRVVRIWDTSREETGGTGHTNRHEDTAKEDIELK